MPKNPLKTIRLKIGSIGLETFFWQNTWKNSETNLQMKGTRHQGNALNQQRFWYFEKKKKKVSTAAT